ncbi:MAG: hypothetical protein CM15mP64_4890 [Candidatus Neomarinimicrobiota bacterium]|nr:MAG: hypothetical protein CM15mP64_4890 [Candidatus Neomarinimicrobiota bacterium]
MSDPLGPNGDWKHLNSIDYNEDLDQIIISSRHHDEIYIIDHSTTMKKLQAAPVETLERVELFI